MRLVLDTNVWLDWLVFNEPAVAPMKAAVAAGRAEIVADDAAEAELARVLAYPFGARSLDARAQAAALGQCLAIARKHEGGRSEPGFRRTCLRTFELANASRDATRLARDDLAALPRCDDPDDQKFLELALACGAQYLVTRDAALLDLARHKTRPLPFSIVTPAQLAAILDGTAG